MALKVSDKNSQAEKSINEVYEGIKTMLTHSFNSIDSSHNYFKMGLDDEFGNFLAENINSPITTILSQGISAQMDAISKFLETGTTAFFVDNKEKIKSVYRTNKSGNFLHYYILLKKDTLKNRRNFFDFLNDYEKENISKQFPIFFDFISARRAKNVKIAKVIALDDEKSFASSSAQ